MMIGAVIAAFSSFLVLMNQLEAGEPYWVATRGFVSEKVEMAQASLAKRVIDTQITIERAERRRIETQMRDREILLQQNSTAPDGLRRVILDQISELKQQFSDTSGRIDALERERSSRRP